MSKVGARCASSGSHKVSNEPVNQVWDQETREAYAIRAAELRAELALVEHLGEHGPGADAAELRAAHGHAAHTRAELEQRVNERAIQDAIEKSPTVSFRWGYATLPAMLWLCSCGAQNQSINPQLKAAWDKGARPPVLVRCPTCGSGARLIESSLIALSR